MLPCVCSVIDNRRRQNVVRTKNKVAHEAIASVSLMFLPHFDVICDLLLYRRTATWNLFYVITKQIATHNFFVYFKILQHNAKADLRPVFAHFGEGERGHLT